MITESVMSAITEFVTSVPILVLDWYIFNAMESNGENNGYDVW